MSEHTLTEEITLANIGWRQNEDAATPTEFLRAGSLERLGKQVKHWQSRMQLDPWNIQVRFCPPKESRCAHITYDIYRRQALLSVGEDVPEHAWDWAVVHELVHLLLIPIEAVTEELLDTQAPAIRDLQAERLDDATEILINHLAELIVGGTDPHFILKPGKYE